MTQSYAEIADSQQKVLTQNFTAQTQNVFNLNRITEVGTEKDKQKLVMTQFLAEDFYSVLNDLLNSYKMKRNQTPVFMTQKDNVTFLSGNIKALLKTGWIWTDGFSIITANRKKVDYEIGLQL